MEVLAGAALGLGALNYADTAAAKKRANIQNAFANKWGPLLSVNGGKGAAHVDAPSANLGQSMVPAALAAGMLLNGGKKAQAPLSGYGTDWANPPSGVSPLAGTGATAADIGAGGTVPLLEAGGGYIGHRYAGGGYPTGGMVPGPEIVPGDSKVNDVQPVIASGGEVILPKSVASEGMKGHSWKVAKYLHDVKKHGPGPMPVKSPQHAKPMAKSLSPWKAMAMGGKC